MSTPAASGRWLVWLLGAIMLARLLSLGAYPLMDTSEARYGEIARVMLETGNWVTPQEIPGTPFWAKPPLYAWLSAGAMALLGVSELAARLPAWLCAVGVLALVLRWAAPRGWLAAAMLACMPGFLVNAGAVMTDPVLVLCLAGMWLALHEVMVAGKPARWAGYGFFVAAGAGMLAKGPVIGVFVLVPVLGWAASEGRLRELWARLPGIRGGALALLICLPWYLLAESRTPGFLKYFLLGEHVLRFLQPGWEGDRYGTAHAEATGTIWLYALAACGPLALWAAPTLLRALWQRLRRKSADLRAAQAPGADASGARLALWLALFPLVFFTFAGNIIWTYAFPSLVPLAVWLAWQAPPTLSRRALTGLVLCAALPLTAIFLWAPSHVNRHSARTLLTVWHTDGPAAGRANGLANGPLNGLPNGPICYLGRKSPASLRFYARGAVVPLRDLDAVLARTAAGGAVWLALAADESEAVSGQLQARGVQARKRAENSDLALLELAPAPGQAPAARPGAAPRPGP